MAKTQSIVRLQSHPNRTPTGRRSVTATRKLVAYLSYGRGTAAQRAQRAQIRQQPQRGGWIDQDGRMVTPEAVQDWVQAAGKAQPYTHQLILSVSQAWLPAAAYNQALAAGEDFFHEWRLIPHTDSPYPHAHVVAFGAAEIQIKAERFQQWAQTVRLALERQQQAALDAMAKQQAQLNQAAQPGQAASREISAPERVSGWGWEL